MVDLPALTVLRTGFTAKEKSERKTVSARFAVCDTAVPVTVTLRGLDVVADRPVTVRVLLCPASIEVGLNVQLAPDPQARVMLLVNELGAVAVTVKVVVVVPITIAVDLGLAERAKTGFPVPVRETLCAPVLALILTEPVRLPVAVGVKVTAIEQLAPTFRTPGREPQLLVCRKSPLAVIAVRVTAA